MNTIKHTHKFLSCFIAAGLLTSCQLGGGLGFPSPQILSLIANKQQELVVDQPIALNLNSIGGILDVHGKEPDAPTVIKWRLQNPEDGDINNGQFIPKRAGKVVLIAEFKHGTETFILNISDKTPPVKEVIVQPVTPDNPANTIVKPEDIIPLKPTPEVETVDIKLPTINQVQVNSISLSPSTIQLSRVGESSLFNVMARDQNGDFLDTASLKLVWTSSHPETIGIDSSGRVTSIKSGGATITLIEPDSGLSATATVSVVSSGTGISEPVNSVSGSVTF